MSQNRLERLEPNQAEAISTILERSGRPAVPIRKTFLQQGSGRKRKSGPLAGLVTRHDESALDLYCLAHALASKKPWDVTLPSQAWARALRDSSSRTSREAVSKTFGRLDQARLISRERSGRLLKVTLLDESGDGRPYRRPTSAAEPWLQLAHRYWTDGWHLRLKLPAKAMLLISLSLDPAAFWLPADKVPGWYGLSESTAREGFSELVDHGLLADRDEHVQTPLSATGWTTKRWYTLSEAIDDRQLEVADVLPLPQARASRRVAR